MLKVRRHLIQKKSNCQLALPEHLVNRNMNEEMRQVIKAFEADHRIHTKRWERQFRWFLNYVKAHADTMTERHRMECFRYLSFIHSIPDGVEGDPEFLSFLRFCRKAAKVGRKGKVVMVNPSSRKLLVFKTNLPQYLREGYRLP